MNIFDVFAAIGLFAGDVFAALGLCGSAFLLLWVLAGKRIKRVPETMWVWAWGGTTIGLICFVSMLVTETRTDKVGFFFGWPPSVVGGLLAVAVALLGLSVALHLSRGPQLHTQADAAKRRR